MSRFHYQDAHFNRARISLRQTVNRYTQQLRSPKRSAATVALQAGLKHDLDQLSDALEKLNHNLLRIAVFGLVSRGKSAVLNALLGQKILQTGPINGVTQYPRSVCWFPTIAGNTMQVELIDTPGLDEIGGQVRESIAREVVDQADLILFVIAGDMTRTEYRALAELQATHKPLILVFNKIDLYPDQDKQTIYRKLQTLFAKNTDHTRPLLAPDDIVMVAAEPAPLEVRVEYADGRVEYEWETPPPQVEELRQLLLTILHREGKSLSALNALRQARETEAAIAHKSLKLHHTEAEELIWQFARWKAIAIAANPIAVLDLVGGAVTDLAMIRSLAKLYGLPMTRYEAGKLLKSILLSSGGLLLGELGSTLLLGVGKSASAVAGSVDPTGLMAYGGAAIAQASLAGYGSYRVGKAAQIYLEQGCTWGPQGANTVIQEIFNQVDPNTIIYRLRREFGQ
ncbi:GTP-binding protein [Oculatella sp. LEGE 06141]|uniref:GTP-binding protein n=1 Tax=Oculatella sp. LEGE 06141 TaxID=1828648 RepID=UPI0018808F00|nr:GTP-binding protein [Oculatella sp. LEGE 06141]